MVVRLAGLAVASLGLISSWCYLRYIELSAILAAILHSFAVGASSIALFARIGGEAITTKSC